MLMISVKEETQFLKAAGFAPPIIKGNEEQVVLDTLWKSQKIVTPPIGTTPKEKLHDNLTPKNYRTRG